MCPRSFFRMLLIAIFSMSESVVELYHVKIRPGRIRAVHGGIGIVQKPVAQTKPFSDRKAGAHGQGKLERSTVVLSPVFISAEQRKSSTQIQDKPPVFFAETQFGDERDNKTVFSCCPQQPGARHQPSVEAPARFGISLPRQLKVRRQVILLKLLRLLIAKSGRPGNTRTGTEAQQPQPFRVARPGSEQAPDEAQQHQPHHESSLRHRSGSAATWVIGTFGDDFPPCCLASGIYQ